MSFFVKFWWNRPENEQYFKLKTKIVIFTKGWDHTVRDFAETKLKIRKISVNFTTNEILKVLSKDLLKDCYWARKCFAAIFLSLCFWRW